MTPPIETPRVRLEPWQPDDWRALHAIASEPEVMRYITNGAPWNETQTQEFVARQLLPLETHRQKRRCAV